MGNQEFHGQVPPQKKNRDLLPQRLPELGSFVCLLGFKREGQFLFWIPQPLYPDALVGSVVYHLVPRLYHVKV